MKKCKECRGSGIEPVIKMTETAIYVTDLKDCKVCNGKGYLRGK
jgi:DnaJ-class molecular chaperone